MRWKRTVGAILAVSASVAAPAGAPPASAPAAPMTYVYNAPESAGDVRYLYQWEILRAALEKTAAKWGPSALVPSEPMTERRQRYELQHATGRLSVMYLDTSPELERTLRPIRIPVDRNLVGFRVFLVRKGESSRFAGVRSVEDLRRFSFGLGFGWLDVEILRSSRLRVVTGSSYEGLFEMLANRRFDVFLRGAVEALDEYDARKSDLPLEIEDSLLLYYPLPMYFWFPKTPEGERLAARAEEGMRAMLADGSYDRIFEKYQGWKIERLKLRERRVLRIDNPLLGPETPFADRRLWFDPATWKPAAPKGGR